MALALLQSDFPAEGPWGANMAEAYAGLARQIADQVSTEAYQTPHTKPLSKITCCPLARTTQ